VLIYNFDSHYLFSCDFVDHLSLVLVNYEWKLVAGLHNE